MAPTTRIERTTYHVDAPGHYSEHLTEAAMYMAIGRVEDEGEEAVATMIVTSGTYRSVTAVYPAVGPTYMVPVWIPETA